MPLKKENLELSDMVDLELLGEKLKYHIEKETKDDPLYIAKQIYKADPETFYIYYYSELYYLENNEV
jgi:hypothetical protein